MSDLWVAPEPGTTRAARLATDLSRAEIARYAGASGDVNLVHVDEPFAVAAGHPGVLAHGMLTMGLTGSFLCALVGHARVRRFGGQFRGPVHAGDSLDCTVEVSSRTDHPHGTELVLTLRTTTTEGAVVFVGEAVAVHPHEERS